MVASVYLAHGFALVMFGTRSAIMSEAATTPNTITHLLRCLNSLKLKRQHQPKPQPAMLLTGLNALSVLAIIRVVFVHNAELLALIGFRNPIPKRLIASIAKAVGLYPTAIGIKYALRVGVLENKRINTNTHT